MVEEYISAELTAILDDEYTASDIDDLIERANQLIKYIELLPDYPDKWMDAYIRATSAYIHLLSGAARFLDAVLFADPVITKLKKIEYSEISEQTLSILCKGISRAACCQAQMGNRKQAFDYLHHVALLLESVDSNSAKVRFYISISSCYEIFGNPEDNADAIEYASQAVKISRQHNLHKYIPNSLVNLIHYTNASGKHDEAIGYGEELISYLEESDKNPHFTKNFFLSRAYVTGHSTLGESWLGKGDLVKALQYFKASMNLIEKYGPFPCMKVYVLIGLGSVQLASGKYDEALEHLQSAVEAAISADHVASLSKCYELLSNAYVVAGNYELALHYSKLFRDCSRVFIAKSAALSYEALEAKHGLTAVAAYNEQLEKINIKEKKLSQTLADRNAELTSYTNVINNELRSRLQAIELNVRMTEENISSKDDVKKQSKEIAESVQSIEQIISDVLLASKIGVEDRIR